MLRQVLALKTLPFILSKHWLSCSQNTGFLALKTLPFLLSNSGFLALKTLAFLLFKRRLSCSHNNAVPLSKHWLSSLSSLKALPFVLSQNTGFPLLKRWLSCSQILPFLAQKGGDRVERGGVGAQPEVAAGVPLQLL